MANRAPAAPARAAEVTKAIILYFVMLTPTLSAAMRLSRIAMMARPARLFTRWNTTISVIITRIKPAVKVEIFWMPPMPMGPAMMSLPPSDRLVLSLSRLMCRPFLSTPT